MKIISIVHKSAKKGKSLQVAWPLNQSHIYVQ